MSTPKRILGYLSSESRRRIERDL
jgi:hypothetical protein